MIRKFLLTAALAVTAALAAPSASQAAFTLTFQVGANTLVVTDNGVGDSNPLAGKIDVNPLTPAFFGYDLSEYGARTSSPGTLGDEYVLSQRGQITKTDNSAAPLKVTVFSDGFVQTGFGLTVANRLANTLLQGTGVTTTGQTTVTPGGVSPLATVSTNGGSDNTFFNTTTVGTFSMSNEFNISGLNKGKSYVGSLTTAAFVPTPAPAGLILAALGLPAFGLLRRKFRKVIA